MLKLVSFGPFFFVDSIVAYSDNFADLVPRTMRLPAYEGGFDEYADDAAPSEIGNVRVEFILKASTRAEMIGLRDGMRELARYGVQELVVEPEPGADQRYCRARVNSISMPQNVSGLNQFNQRVRLDFQVSYPRWLGVDTPADSGDVSACSGALTTFTRSSAGNAFAIPVITLTATSAISSAGFTIQRYDGGVAEQIVYAAALADTDVVVIDCQDYSVEKNGSDAYSTAFTASHPVWFRLKKGSNEIRVILGVGETADVKLDWEDAWY